MRPLELLAGARELSAFPRLGDVITVRTGESGPSAESVDTTAFVMDGLAHAVIENRRTLEDAQLQLDSFFNGRVLSLAAHIQKMKRQEELHRGY